MNIRQLSAREILCVISFALVALWGISAVTSTADDTPNLFGDEWVAQSDQHQSAPQTENHVKRERQTSADLSAIAQSKLGKTVRLNLFGNRTYIAKNQSINTGTNGELIWTGAIVGEQDSSVTIVAYHGIIAGTVSLDDELYKISYTGSGVYRIEDVTYADPYPEPNPMIPWDYSPDIAPEVARSQADANANAGADDGSVIDVMVLYTPAVLQQYGGVAGITALLNLAIAESNEIYTNSNINTRLRMVHSAQVTYTESGNMNTDLSRLTDVDGYMDEIHALRDRYKADMVQLVTNASDYCGLAWMMNTPSISFENRAFSIGSSGCITGYYTFAHELGHNMGSAHDRASSSSAPKPYSYGYRDPAGQFRTVMAYNCSSGCTRVKYFSNPKVRYNGLVTGVDYASDPSRSADNARAINENLAVIAQWRNSTSIPVTIPTATAIPPTEIPAMTGPPTGSRCVAPAWNGSTTYHSGQIVSHNGSKWEAKWWTRNNEPDINLSNGHWKYVGVCSGSIQPTAVPPRTVWPTAVPPTTVPPANVRCVAPIWNGSTIYYGGEIVSHDGREWRAKWWTRNNMPDINLSFGSSHWLFLGDC